MLCCVNENKSLGSTDWLGSTLFELAMVRTTLAQRRLDQGGKEAVEKFQQEINAIIKLHQVQMRKKGFF